MGNNQKNEKNDSNVNNNKKKKSKMESGNKNHDEPIGGGREGRGRGNSRSNNNRGGGRGGRNFNRGGRGNRHSNKKINANNDSTEKPNSMDNHSICSTNTNSKNNESNNNKNNDNASIHNDNSAGKNDDSSYEKYDTGRGGRNNNSGRGRGGRGRGNHSGRGRGKFNNNRGKHNKPPIDKENSQNSNPSKNTKNRRDSRTKKKNHHNQQKQQHDHNEEDTSLVDDSQQQRHEVQQQNGKEQEKPHPVSQIERAYLVRVGPTLPFPSSSDPDGETDGYILRSSLIHDGQNREMNDTHSHSKKVMPALATPKEVSVTTSTKIKINNADDNESNDKNSSKEPVYFDLLQRNNNSSSKTEKNTSNNPKSNKSNKGGKNDNKNDNKSKKKKKKKKNNSIGSNGDSKDFIKALKAFNRSVRQCVDRSDPDTLYNLLHDSNNHCYTLNDVVLETLLKAYVVAAMFEDALYCLRNVVSPETLKTNQTENILQCLPQNLRNSNAYTAADMMDALCIATKLGDKRAYFLRIVRGIALEFLEEATNARDRICSAPCERLVRAGVCLINVAFKRGKKASDLVVISSSTNKHSSNNSNSSENSLLVLEDGNRGIQAGDAVGILPYAGPYPMSAQSLDRNMIEATVTTVQPLVLRLQDKTNSALYAMLTMQENLYRIDKLANRMGFNRQLAAAVTNATPYNYNDNDNPDDDNFNSHLMKKDAKRPAPELIRAITSMDIQQKKEEKNNLHSINQPQLTTTAAICARPVSFTEDEYYSNGNNDDDDNLDEKDYATREVSRLAMEKYGALQGLNSSQQLAVEGAVTNRLTLIQGPPGTGKTAVGIRILQHWTRISGGKPVLATSDSNIAVDNLVEGCANVGLRVIRLGRPEAIRPELLRFCIDRPQQNNNSSQHQHSSSHPSSQSQSNYNSSGGYVSTAQAYKEKKETLKNAQVVCCTCIGSGSDILDGMIFERVLVDEATQATEPAVLVPLTRGCRQLVLVGDHCQLPPTVLSTRAEEEGLGVPLFSRMVACGVPPFMLDTQYRMHPCIAMFPSDLFYGGKLLNGVSAPERRPLAGFPWPREEFPVAFVPVPHGIEVDDGVSKLNEAEAAAACDAVAALLAGGQCTTSDIAVVTPYAAQVRLIRRLTRKLVGTPPFVEVSSTDGFQGREKEAVVFSAVRSNNAGMVGFVSNWRRVNVSFTRARRALIVIGNDVCLRRGDPDTWMPWLAWADAHGINMDKPGVPRGRYEPEQLRRVRGGTTAAEMLKDVLARQQAQLKTAEKHLEKAEKKSQSAHPQHQHLHDNNTIGEGNYHMGNSSNGMLMGGIDNKALLEEDLAKLSNTDGCWDDSDDDDNQDGGGMHPSSSRLTLATMSTTNTKEEEEEEELQDAWDL